MAKKRAAERANSAASSLAAIGRRLRCRLLYRRMVLKILHNLRLFTDRKLRHASAFMQILVWPPAPALKRVRGEASGGIAVAVQERRVQAIATGASDFQTTCEAMEAIDLVVPLAIGHHRRAPPTGTTKPPCAMGTTGSRGPFE